MMLIFVLVLIFSIVVHEVAHGWTAWKLGDDTAYRMGRLTLNPIPHIDPMGSILVPLIMSQTLGVPFGWAKPVPVNPGRLNDPMNDHPKVAAAGPASNILLALIFAVLLGVERALWGAPPGGPHGEPSLHLFVDLLFQGGVRVNVILAMFNLVPIPPLDGSWILSRFLPPEARANYENLRSKGMIVFLGFILVLNFTPIGPLFWGASDMVAGKFFEISNTLIMMGRG